MRELQIIHECLKSDTASALIGIDRELALKVVKVALNIKLAGKWKVILMVKSMFPSISLLEPLVAAFNENSPGAIHAIMALDPNNTELINEAFLQSIYYKMGPLVETFLKFGANINYISTLYEFGDNRSSAWSIVISENNLRMAKLLVCSDADVHQYIDPNGLKPIDVARLKSPEIAAYLRSAILYEGLKQRRALTMEVPVAPSREIEVLSR